MPGQKLLKGVIALWLLFGSTLSAYAWGNGEQLEIGLHAYSRGDFTAAIQQWRPLADNGNQKAQLYLAYMYRRGKGVGVDPQTAAKWYQQAASQGNANAQYELGLMYELGLGLSANHTEAVYWYGLAEAQGYCPGELSAGGILGDE